jgi:hypothetical protein
MFPCLRPRTLNLVFGVTTIPQNRKRLAQTRSLVAFDQLGERACVGYLRRFN